MKLTKLLLITLLSTATLFAGFSKVHCDNEANLTVLKIPQGECEALEAIWDATGHGEKWTNKTNWDSMTSAGEWFGITLTDDNSSVNEIFLNNNNMTGYLPSEIAKLTHLRRLIIANDKTITGVIPPEIMNMPSLEVINIGGNSLTGKIPEVINLPNLTVFGLYKNDQLTGGIPQSFDKLTNIEEIVLYKNNLSGTLPDLSSLKKLYDFDITNNNYTFADLEPQMGWLGDIVNNPRDDSTAPTAPIGQYAPQKLVSEPDTVYYSDTLTLTPSLPAHAGDVYKWYDDNGIIEGATQRVLQINDSSKIQSHYSYNVTNPNVTLYKGQYLNTVYLILRSEHMQVLHDNTPKVSNKNPNTQTTEDKEYTYTSKISDADSNDTLTVTATALPAWLTLTPEANNFTLSGTPTGDDLGSHDINLTITDGKIPVHINYTLVVKSATQPNHAPTIAGTPKSEVNAGEPYTFTPTAKDADSDDTLTYTITNKPSWATFDPATGTLSGTPKESDVKSYTNITITVSDSLEKATLPAFNINVKSLLTPNTTPTITGTPETEVNVEETYTFTPTAKDADSDDTLTYTITNKPSWASFNASTGALTGTPQESDIGTTANIIISVSDSKATASLPPFNINVNPAGTVAPPPPTSPVKSSGGGVTPLGFGLLFVLLLLGIVGREGKVNKIK